LSAEAARLALETIHRLRISRKFGRQEFKGNEAAQLDIFGFVYNPHPTTAQLFDDAIVRDGLADHG
jgi:hypothetical protein